MGILNNALGINLTIYDPLINSPFGESPSLSYVATPKGTEYMISETGAFMQEEIGNDLMITE